MKRTALYELHKQLGGKIVEFAGYELPIQYSKGIIAEHKAVRQSLGLFDVSHMGEILIEGEFAGSALQKLVSNVVATMSDGQCRYSLLCYEDGGIVDDIIIYKFNNYKYMLVVNASNTDKDFEWISNNIENAKATNLSDQISQIAVQGRNAQALIEKIVGKDVLPEKNYHFVYDIDFDSCKVLISSTGYTGEKGYEIYCKNSDAVAIFEKLLDEGVEFDTQPIGLGARDTLRFEASMPLYGHELTADTKLNELGLNFAIKAEDFIGAKALQDEPKFKRIGLKIVDKGIAREHALVYDVDGTKIGEVSSGMPCPTLGGNYAMARVCKSFAGDKVLIDVRGRMLMAEITKMPFYVRD